MITQMIELDFSLEHFSYMGNNINEKNSFLLDIETTGFSSKTNSVYLIGCIFYDGNTLKLIQWLSEKPEDEYQLLFTFSKFISHYPYVIHYNGANFDIPFLAKRLELYHINSSISTLKQFDLYTKARPIGKYLPIDNLKLISVEQYYGINRKDQFTGGELIEKYLAFEKSNNLLLKELLLLHNHEDLCSLYYCLDLCHIINFYKSACNKTLKFTTLKVSKTSDYIIIDIPYPCNFNLRIENQLYDLFISNYNIAISFPIYVGELKLFFDDFENYFYLPLEDQVVHKSVGKFVEPAFRKRAKKSNCYIKKRGNFIPLNSKVDIKLKTFVKDYTVTHKYVEVTPDLLENQEKLLLLCSEVLSHL
jgi:uncharacterized protein YprB with RNaseH-like and TPR domain